MTHLIKKTDFRKIAAYVLTGAATGMANGLFGSGGGMIAVPAMVILLQMNDHTAHATAIFVILPLTILSAFLYVSGEFADWNITWKVILGGIAGGFAGARLLKVLPESVLRRVFAVFIIAGAIRMMTG